MNGCLMNGSSIYPGPVSVVTSTVTASLFARLVGLQARNIAVTTNYAQRPRIVVQSYYKPLLPPATTTLIRKHFVILKDHRCFFLTLCFLLSGGFRLVYLVLDDVIEPTASHNNSGHHKISGYKQGHYSLCAVTIHTSLKILLVPCV